MTNQDKERKDGIVIVGLVGLLAAALWIGRQSSAIPPAAPQTPPAPAMSSVQPMTIKVAFSQ